MFPLAMQSTGCFSFAFSSFVHECQKLCKSNLEMRLTRVSSPSKLIFVSGGHLHVKTVYVRIMVLQTEQNVYPAFALTLRNPIS